MTKIKGKNVSLVYTASNKKMLGVTSENIKLTTKFDEERDKTTSDGPQRNFMWVELTATISGKVKDAGTGEFTLAEIQSIADTGKYNSADVSAKLNIGGTNICYVDKVLFSNFSLNAPVNEKATYSVSVKGIGKAKLVTA